MALAAVLARLGRLPELDRAALLMQADGVPYEDIARALGIGVAAAKVRVHRARRRLASSETNAVRPSKT
jgi:RNA polymerase sigma-70 factor, ECF subfamily